MGRVPRRLLPTDPDYPGELRDLEDTPPLDVRGSLPPSTPRVAIVGSRRVSVEAAGFTRRLAFDLAAGGLVVISGGALGVDAAAHEGALDAETPTWVVLAGRVDTPQPQRNRDLFARIERAGGGFLAEADRPFQPSELVRRNRIVAALAQVVVIVQGDASSGTRHTLRFARALGRPVGAVPWSPWDERGAIPRQALTRGAFCVATANDVRRALGLRTRRRGWLPKLLRPLRDGPLTPDALAERAGMAADLVRIELGRWELEGRVRRRAGRYELCAR